MVPVVAPTDPTARTRAGAVRGMRLDGVSAFWGIPFAAPPLGERRFRPPQPAPAFDPATRGCLDGTRPGPAPPQLPDPLSARIGLDFPGPQREDCLQLNVFTPAADGGRRPVLVWLHGGAFATGSGTSPAYAGHRLAARGDVVVVTLNYRVGALGFLHLRRWVPGAGGPNLGLLDQIAALRWVEREIAAFGGDPDRVTLFGESAGAGSAVALLAMPAARGLFRRAVLQSPAADGMLEDAEATERARGFLDRLGQGAPSLEQLQQLPVEALLEAQQACMSAGPHRTGMFFAPVVDGTILPERPLAAIARGAARGTELVIGTTEEEMQLYATIPGMGELSDEQLLRAVASRVEGDRDRRESVARAALHLYRDELGRRRQRDLFFALETDLSLRLPAIRLAESQSAVQPRTWMYLFRWRSPASDGGSGRLGACHAVDLPFTFGALEAGPLLAFAAGDDPETARRARALSQRWMDAWIAFAHRGDPSHPGLGGDWPPYEPTRRATLCFDVRCRVLDAPLEARRRIWDAAAAGRPGDPDPDQ